MGWGGVEQTWRVNPGRTFVITCLHWPPNSSPVKMSLIDTFPLQCGPPLFLLLHRLTPSSTQDQQSSRRPPYQYHRTELVNLLDLFLYVVNIFWRCSDTCFVHKPILTSQVIFVKPQPSRCFMVFHFHPPNLWLVLFILPDFRPLDHVHPF